MSEKDRCYMCDCPGVGETVKDEDWDLPSLKMILEQFKICERHKKYCETRIPELEKKIFNEIIDESKNKKYGPSPAVEFLKRTQEKKFIPKPMIKKKDYAERAANDGDLIE